MNKGFLYNPHYYYKCNALNHRTNISAKFVHEQINAVFKVLSLPARKIEQIENKAMRLLESKIIVKIQQLDIKKAEMNKNKEGDDQVPSGGDGGNRTRVQTYSPKAFYMLISLLIVGDIQEKNKPIYYLAGWS